MAGVRNYAHAVKAVPEVPEGGFILDPKNSGACAAAFVSVHYTKAGRVTLRRNGGVFYREPVAGEGRLPKMVGLLELNAELWDFLSKRCFMHKGATLVPLRVNKSLVSEIVFALKSTVPVVSNDELNPWLLNATTR